MVDHCAGVIALKSSELIKAHCVGLIDCDDPDSSDCHWLAVIPRSSTALKLAHCEVLSALKSRIVIVTLEPYLEVCMEIREKA